MANFIPSLKQNRIPTNRILPETKLIAACKRNERKAQLQLYKKYCDAMYFTAFRFLKNSMEAEDAMQEAFITAFSRLHQFNGESTFGAWLKKITIHKSLDFLRAKKMEFTALNEQVLQTVEENEDWQVDDAITREQVKKTIEKLPSKYRYALLLFLMEGYDHEEISEILKISQVSSRTLVHRGKKMLKEELKEKYHGTGS